MKRNIQFIGATVTSCCVFLFLFLAFQWNLIVSAALAIGVYFGMFFLLKPSYKIGDLNVDQLEHSKEIQQLMMDAKDDMEDIRKATSKINNQKIKIEAQTLYSTSASIMKYLEKNPDKIIIARRFLTYYLDTANKILTKYCSIQNTGLDTEEVSNILSQTAKVLPMLNKTFDEQFTRLMRNELIDIEAEISLLESMVKMEGKG